MPPSEIHVQKFKSKEMNILKRNNEFVSTCKTPEILHREQPLSTAVKNKAVGDLKREPHQHSTEEKGAQDPDPDVGARQDFWKESCCLKNETLCSEGRFSTSSELH